MRRVIAIVIWSAGMIAVWLAGQAILTARVFGDAFAWGFGSVFVATLFLVPLAVDRDDLTQTEAYCALALSVGATAVFWAGAFRYGLTDVTYYYGGLLAALISLPLSYWAFGDDRRRRGVPRATSLFGSRRSAGADYLFPPHR